eukprot:2242898-Rhodomonas_salina.1
MQLWDIWRRAAIIAALRFVCCVFFLFKSSEAFAVVRPGDACFLLGGTSDVWTTQRSQTFLVGSNAMTFKSAHRDLCSHQRHWGRTNGLQMGPTNEDNDQEKQKESKTFVSKSLTDALKSDAEQKEETRQRKRGSFANRMLNAFSEQDDAEEKQNADDPSAPGGSSKIASDRLLDLVGSYSG